MRLTPDMMEASYVMLRTCLPFRRWNLPDPDDVKFIVTHRKNEYGECDVTYEPPSISASAFKIKTLSELNETMAHECIHLHLHVSGSRGALSHGAIFKRLAQRVCRELGFPLENF